MSKPTKKELLAKPVEHIDITKIDGKTLVDAYGKMSFSARDLARAARIYDQMLADPNSFLNKTAEIIRRSTTTA